MKRIMNFLGLFFWAGFRLIGIGLAMPFVLAGCQDKNYAKIPENSSEEELQEIKTQDKQEDLVKKGKYLVTSVGCGDCHSPKKMGERGPEEIHELKLSGYQQGNKLPPMETAALEKGWMLMNPDLTAAVGPWGVSFAANITSDDTGIGNWSYEQFETAIRKGKYKGMENGRDMLPPMPWPALANFNDKDLEAIFAYLQSTTPVHNVVPPPIPPNKLSSMEGN